MAFLAPIGAFVAANAGVIAAGASIGSLAVGVKASKRSAQASATLARRQAVQASAQRRGGIRKTLAARFQMKAQAQALGMRGGSGAAGGSTSAFSQLGTNLGLGLQLSGLSREASAFNAQANQLQAYSGLLSSASTMVGGLDEDTFDIFG